MPWSAMSKETQQPERSLASELAALRDGFRTLEGEVKRLNEEINRLKGLKTSSRTNFRSCEIPALFKHTAKLLASEADRSFNFAEITKPTLSNPIFKFLIYFNPI